MDQDDPKKSSQQNPAGDNQPQADTGQQSNNATQSPQTQKETDVASDGQGQDKSGTETTKPDAPVPEPSSQAPPPPDTSSTSKGANQGGSKKPAGASQSTDDQGGGASNTSG